MVDLESCPDVSDLERLADGRLALGTSEALERHLTQCRSCFDRHDRFFVDLIGLLRGCSSSTPHPEQAEIDRLAGELKSLAGQLTLNETLKPNPTPPEFAPSDSPRPVVSSGPLERLGPYRVQKQLGQGGMGTVYLAEDETLHRKVALKVMRPELAMHPQAKERFLREARSAAALLHDHIVTVFYAGEETGIPYLVMQLLEGEALDEMLKHTPIIPLSTALRIARETALGLSAAHKHGLIHRDIKPSNLWIETTTKDNLAGTSRIKILDFGLARMLEQQGELSNPGAVLGTPAFMAPEQALGVKVDARCDLFSLGCVLYRMTTGRLPFGGENLSAQLLALTTHTPKPVGEINPSIPTAVCDLIRHLLEKDPEDRPVSAEAVAEQLARLERGELLSVPHVVPPPKTVSASEPPPRKPPNKLLMGFLAAVVLIAGIIITIKVRKPDGTEYSAELNFLGSSKNNLNKDGDNKDAPKKDKDGSDSGNRKVAPDPDRPKLEKDIPGPGCACFSVDGTLLYTGCNVRDMPRGFECIYSLDGKQLKQSDELECIGMIDRSPDGKWFAYGGGNTNQDGQVHLRSTDSNQSFRLKGQMGEINGLKFSHDSKWLITTGRTQKSFVWDLSTRKVSFTADGVCRAAHPSKNQLAFCVGPFLRLLNTETRDFIDCRGHEQGMGQAAYSPDGDMIATTSNDCTVRLWDSTNGKALGVLARTDLYQIAACWTRDGNYLLTADYKDRTPNRVHIWDVATRSLVVAFKAHDSNINCLSISPDGKRLLTTSSDDYRAKLWTLPEWASRPPGKKPRLAWKHDEVLDAEPDPDMPRQIAEFIGPQSACFSTDGRTLFTGSNECIPPGDVYKGYERVYSLKGKLEKESGEMETLYQIARSPDGQWFAYGGGYQDREEAVHLRSTDFKQTFRLSGNVGEISSIHFSHDSKWLATSGRDQKTFLWDLATRKVASKFDGRAVGFHPRKTQLAIVSKTMLRLLDIETKKSIDITGPEPGLSHAAYSPDGETIAVTCGDKSVRLWDTVTGRSLGLIAQTDIQQSQVCWTKDGKYIITGDAKDSYPNKVHVWEVEGRVLKLKFPAHIQGIVSLSISPDGKRLLTASGDLRAKIWELPEWASRPGVKKPEEGKPEDKKQGSTTPPPDSPKTVEGLLAPRAPLCPKEPKEGSVNDLGIGWNGARWALSVVREGNNYAALRWDGKSWVRGGPKWALRITVDPDGHEWTIDDQGQIFSQNIGRYLPEVEKSVARDLAIAPDGKVYVLGGEAKDGDYPVLLMRTLKDEKLDIHRRCRFDPLPEGDLRGVRLAVSPRDGGTVVTIRANGDVYYGPTHLTGTKAVDIATDGAGGLFILGTEKNEAGEYPVLEYAGDFRKEHRWQRIKDRAGVRIVGDHKKGFWLLSAQGEIHQP